MPNGASWAYSRARHRALVCAQHAASCIASVASGDGGGCGVRLTREGDGIDRTEDEDLCSRLDVMYEETSVDDEYGTYAVSSLPTLGHCRQTMTISWEDRRRRGSRPGWRGWCVERTPRRACCLQSLCVWLSKYDCISVLCTCTHTRRDSRAYVCTYHVSLSHVYTPTVCVYPVSTSSHPPCFFPICT